MDIQFNLKQDLIDRTFVEPPLEVDRQTSLREALVLLKQHAKLLLEAPWGPHP